MLVLARKLYQKIIFHGLDTSVQVVDVDRGIVRLGIQAPPEILVLRDELQPRDSQQRSSLTRLLENVPGKDSRDFKHMLRNRLNAATLGLALLRQQQESSLTDAARRTLATIDHELHAISRGLDVAPASAPTRPQKPCKALLVEDNVNERELLAGYLRMAGVGVDAVGDGLDAIEYLHSHESPDVVLMDMGLPRCDGMSTIRKIRGEPAFAGLKIFAVTGRTPEEMESSEGPSVVDRWFLKPLNPQILLQDLGRGQEEAVPRAKVA